LSAFAGDDDVDAIVDAWIARGKFGKLLDLWVKGLAIDWRRLRGDTPVRRISLPTYPFARERYWIQTGDVRPAMAAAAGTNLHPLLQRNTSDIEGPRFSARFSGHEFFFADHVVRGTRMLPGVAQLEMARRAIIEVAGAGFEPCLRNVSWMRPIVAGSEGIALHVSLYPEADGAIGFEIHGDDDEGLIYAQGTAFDGHAAEAVPHCVSRAPRRIRRRSVTRRSRAWA
jgi:acyl transferase domain-containing protein